MEARVLPETLGAEQVRVIRGRRSDQVIVVSLDSTQLGPALGGCRIKGYRRWTDALNDASRLSAAMTAKAALAGLDHGGGKIVVCLDPRSSSGDWVGSRREDLLADVADVIADLDGRYITGPDIGTSPADMGRLWAATPHVLCRPEDQGGSGDSSAPTALGLTGSISAVCDHLWPGRSLAALRFALLGVGHVGTLVGSWLAHHGAQLVISDVDRAKKIQAEQWGAAWASPRQALHSDVDVVIPCAVGGILTAASVRELRCRAVVGAANNQLDDPSTADLLQSRGICWAPDTVVSAGGIVAAVARELGGATAREATQKVQAIGGRVSNLLAESDAEHITPSDAARRQVSRRMQGPIEVGSGGQRADR